MVYYINNSNVLAPWFLPHQNNNHVGAYVSEVHMELLLHTDFKHDIILGTLQ